jgi:histidinol-phosphate aminotransferase
MTQSLLDLVPSHIREIAPYIPGKPIEEVEREIKTRAIKLASNENAFGPSPKAIKAAKKALEGSNRYPDGGGFYLREALAKRYGVSAECIILGGGSTELIDLAARTLLRPGDVGVSSHGSFPMYYISVRATGARLLEIPLKEYTFDLDSISRNLPAEAKVIYLANPNNPTGTMFTADEFDAFLSRIPQFVLVVLDEAYCDYVQRPDYSRSIELLHRVPNLLVLRTFSKIYGLAGLRIGYGLGPAGFIAEMNKIRSPFNTSDVAQAAALAALDDIEHVRRSTELNRAGLAQLSQGLKALGIGFVPSFANFLLVEMGYDTRGLSGELLKRGVIVRPMGWMGFPQAIRVSAGTHSENEKFLRVLGEFHTAAARKIETHTRG